jgi:hypothetical protein
MEVASLMLHPVTEECQEVGMCMQLPERRPPKHNASVAAMHEAYKT